MVMRFPKEPQPLQATTDHAIVPVWEAVMLFLFLAIALQATPADDAAPRYSQCLWDAARDLEPSGEPTVGVVDAAFSACRSAEPQAGPGSRLASLNSEGQQRVLGEMAALLREDLGLYVMRLRACRNTAGCDLTTVRHQP